MKKLLYSFIFLNFGTSHCIIPKTVLGDRPFAVQEQVDKAFENIKYETTWYLNGPYRWYWLLGLHDKRMIKHLAFREINNNVIDPGCSQDEFVVKHSVDHKDNNDVYIIDVGCGKGGWARKAFDALQDERYKKTGKNFHIFSVTGGKECDDRVEQKGHVTLYQFNQFKIENIDEEFAKRGFDLKNKVNLIVSHWVLRQLADPFGTLKRLYGLLTPAQGKLLSNGFLFKFDTSKHVEGFPGGWGSSNENILANQNSNATLLFNENESMRNANEFLLVRNNNSDINIPLEYTGNIEFIGDRYQCASETVTIYKKGFLPQKFKTEYLEKNSAYRIDPGYSQDELIIKRVRNRENRKVYCDAKDTQCKNLYTFLKKQKLFDTK